MDEQRRLEEQAREHLPGLQSLTDADVYDWWVSNMEEIPDGASGVGLAGSLTVDFPHLPWDVAEAVAAAALRGKLA